MIISIKYLWPCCLNLNFAHQDKVDCVLQILAAAWQLLPLLCCLWPHLAPVDILGCAVVKNVLRGLGSFDDDSLQIMSIEQWFWFCEITQNVWVWWPSGKKRECYLLKRESYLSYLFLSSIISDSLINPRKDEVVWLCFCDIILIAKRCQLWFVVSELCFVVSVKLRS